MYLDWLSWYDKADILTAIDIKEAVVDGSLGVLG